MSLNLIEKNADEQILEPEMNSDFIVKAVDLDLLAEQLLKEEIKGKLISILEVEEKDMSWNKIFDTVSGAKETRDMEIELEE